MSWSVDGKDLSNLAWNIKSRSAGWSVPGRSGENIRVPGKHGSFWTPNKTYEEGRLTLSMWADGCNEDGTIPQSEDARKKVRDNLDKLTSMFSTNRRLLTIRQTTGNAGSSLVNDLTNPTFTTSSNTGIDIAIDGLKDGSLSNSRPVEISRDIFTNPYLKGKTVIDEGYEAPSVPVPPGGGENYPGGGQPPTTIPDPNPPAPGQGMQPKTEDIYPDPSLRAHTKDPLQNLLGSWYYPIRQDVSYFNQFFTPQNGFSWVSGYNGRGLINISKAANFTGRAWIGEIIRKVGARPDSLTTFFMQLRLGSGAKASSVPIKITPSISNDGHVWTVGSTKTFTITDLLQWVIMPASNFAGPAANTYYYVRYAIELPNASSWDQGVAFEVARTAIQDAPRVGNPWIGYETQGHMIIGNETDEVTYQSAVGKSISMFNKMHVPEWVPQITSSRTTTAPYPFVWTYLTLDKAEPRLCFTVFGGPKNTFRRALPKPTLTTTNVRLWGRCTNRTSVPSTLRLMKSTGGGNYVQVASVVCSGPTFSSAAFQLDKGASYVLDIDVSVSSNGMDPSTIFSELHVSNGSVNTIIPEGKSNTAEQYQNNDAATTYLPERSNTNAGYTGEIYESTIVGKSYGVPRLAVGMPREGTALEGTISGTAWASQPGGAYSVAGELTTDAMPLTTNSLDVTDLTVRTYLSVVIPPHIGRVGTMPTAANVVLTLTYYNELGAVAREESQTLTGVNNEKRNYYNTFSVLPGEVLVSASYKYSTTAHPLTEILVERLQFILNRPAGVNYFTGNEVSAVPGWSGIPAWAGTAYFSESYVAATLPATWVFDGFAGFDADGAASFTGTKVRVQANLQEGQVYFGLRRGPYVANQTISVQPEGAPTATPLGSTTATVDFAQGFADVPAGGSTYVDFIVTGSGATKTAREAFAINKSHRVYPLPSTSWAGFSPRSQTTLNLPAHPSSQVPPIKVVRKADGTTELTSGDVEGWTGEVIGGGFIAVPPVTRTENISSHSVPVSGGYVSVGARLLPTPEAVGRITLELQGATDLEYAQNVWPVLASRQITTAQYQELKLVDIPVYNKKFARINIKASNEDSGVTRTGVLATMDGVSLTRSGSWLGTTFPGYFTGIRSSDGTTSFRGDIRQCKAEVVEAIDMESMAYGTIAEFNVNLVVPNSFWEDVYDTTTTVLTSSKSGTIAISDFGGATAPMMDLLMEVQPVTGSLSDFRITDKGSGSTFRYKGPAQSRVSINNALFAVADARGNSLIKNVVETGTAALTPLTPYWRSESESLNFHQDGTPVIVWSSNVPLKITITGRRKYLVG